MSSSGLHGEPKPIADAPTEVRSVARLRVATASRATQLREAHQRLEDDLGRLRAKAAASR